MSVPSDVPSLRAYCESVLGNTEVMSPEECCVVIQTLIGALPILDSAFTFRTFRLFWSAMNKATENEGYNEKEEDATYINPDFVSKWVASGKQLLAKLQAPPTEVQETKPAQEQPAAEEKREGETKPVEEAKPTEESKPAEEVPVTEETKPAEEVPVTEETKPAEEVPVTEETKPAEETKPEEGTKTAEETKPEEGTKTAEETKPEEAPVTEEKPAEDTKPAEEEKPVEKAPEEPKPVEEAKPAEESVSEEDRPAIGIACFLSVARMLCKDPHNTTKAAFATNLDVHSLFLALFRSVPIDEKPDELLQSFFGGMANIGDCPEGTKLYITKEFVDLLLENITLFVKYRNVKSFVAPIVNSCGTNEDNRVLFHTPAVRDALITLWPVVEPGVLSFFFVCAIFYVQRVDHARQNVAPCFCTQPIHQILLELNGRFDHPQFYQNWLGAMGLVNEHNGELTGDEEVYAALVDMFPKILPCGADFICNFFSCLWSVTDVNKKKTNFKRYQQQVCYQWFVESAPVLAAAGENAITVNWFRSLTMLAFNQAGAQLFGTVAIRDALLSLAPTVKDADSAYPFFGAIANLCGEATTKPIFGVAEIRDVFLKLAPLITTDSASDTCFLALRNLLNSTEDSVRALYSTPEFRAFLVSKHTLVQKEDTAQEYFAALCGLARGEHGGTFANLEVANSLLSLKSFVTGDYTAFYFFAAMMNLTSRSHASKADAKVFLGESWRDVFLSLSTHIRSNGAASFFFPALYNVVHADHVSYMQESVAQLLTTLAPRCQTDEAAEYFMGVLTVVATTDEANRKNFSSPELYQACKNIIAQERCPKAHQLYDDFVGKVLFAVMEGSAALPPPLGFTDIPALCAPPVFLRPAYEMQGVQLDAYVPEYGTWEKPVQTSTIPQEATSTTTPPAPQPNPPPQQLGVIAPGNVKPEPMSGFLQKFSTGRNKGLFSRMNWKRRYFRLAVDGNLEYFESDKAQKALGTMTLAPTSSKLVRKPTSKDHTEVSSMLDFVVFITAPVATNSFSLLMRAENETSYQEWVHALSAHCKE